MKRAHEHPGHYLRHWRKALGLTLEDVAEQIGKTHQTLGRIERGEVAYTQKVLERLARVYGTDPGSLIMRNPDDPELFWAIWESLLPAQKRQVAAIAETLKRTAAA